jgi:hypothetical protein
VSGYGLDDRGSIPGRAESSLASASRPVLGPTQPPIQWVPGGPFPGGKARPERDADHLSPSSAEVMNEKELYLPSPQASPWRVAGQLYLTVRTVHMH